MNEQTLERYLASSNLTEEQKKSLRAEYKSVSDKDEVYTKAVRLNRRKAMTKKPVITTK